MIESLTEPLRAVPRIPGWHLYPIYLSIVAFTVLHYRNEVRAGGGGRRALLELSLMNAVGILGFAKFNGFVAHTVFADAVATSIGWGAGSPFQTEVAGANLALGAIGALGFWRRDVWLPFVIGSTAFGFVAGATHVADLMARGNLAPNNIGVLPANFLVPLVLIGLLTLWVRGGGALHGAPRSDALGATPAPELERHVSA